MPLVKIVVGPSGVQPTGVVTEPPVKSVTGTSPIEATGQAGHPITASESVEAAG